MVWIRMVPGDVLYAKKKLVPPKIVWCCKEREVRQPSFTGFWTSRRLWWKDPTTGASMVPHQRYTSWSLISLSTTCLFLCTLVHRMGATRSNDETWNVDLWRIISEPSCLHMTVQFVLVSSGVAFGVWDKVGNQGWLSTWRTHTRFCWVRTGSCVTGSTE